MMRSTARRIRLAFVFAAMLAIAAPASAQTSVVETPLFAKAAAHVGSQYRADVNDAVRDIARGDLAAAEARLAPVRAYCDAQQRPGRNIVSVFDSVEYDAYIAERGDGTPTEWIDIACPSAYYMTGYAAAGVRRYDEALSWLERTIAIAPYAPDAYNERAFIYGQTHRLPEALAAYRQTLALADAYPNGAYIRPLALRGIGYVLIEMGDLDGAQRSYEAALAIDPDNDTAKRELAYIAQQRAAQSTGATAAP